MIKEFYGDKTAKRSGVKLMNHITEGLEILEQIHASDLAKRAYCIHPMVQGDAELFLNFHKLEGLDARVITLAMEYRRVANAYLSRRTISNINEIELSPLEDVNDMLVADKLQNQKDFILYHKDSHPRSKELNEYFNNWFKRLEIDENVWKR